MTGRDASVDATLVDVAASIGAEIDRVFRAAMGAAGRLGGPGLRERHGPGYGELLVEFRTVLAAPDGSVTAAGLSEVTRYRDPVEVDASVLRAVDRGSIVRDRHGAFRATAAGHVFLDDLYATQAMSLGSLWAGVKDRVEGLATITGELVAAVSLAPLLSVGSFTAMTPNYEPVGTPATVLLLNRLSALRYHRSDAHAMAWRSAGLSATEMVTIQESGGSRRDSIEARTNEIAAVPFRILKDDRRGRFLDDLHSLSLPD